MTVLQALPETQLALAISIFVGTFVYEDGATLLAATLSASGRLDPALGIAVSVIGIWTGDIGLYWMGSVIPKYALGWRRFERFLKPESLEKAQAWFAKHGSLALVMSRAIPGSRLPLYLAAGALRLPLRRFVRITGICASLWVLMIFGVWRFTPTTLSGSGNLLRWMLTAVVLAVPWLLGKSLGLSTRAEISKEDANRGSLTACAL
jgi:membrane protein DedA with SNARE-associated domain